jgi:hypothetical protein
VRHHRHEEHERHGGFGRGRERERGFVRMGKRGDVAPDVGEDEVRGWFAGRLPDGWFTGTPTVTVDREEILLVGELAEPDAGSDASEAAKTAARTGRIKGFREDTRETRMRIADEAQRRFGRVVSWGARIGDHEELFTTASVPVMTRLRQDERAVLDTLVDAGVARSRSHALAWCVKLVAQHEGDWIQQLRDALVAVDQARASGPEV